MKKICLQNRVREGFSLTAARAACRISGKLPYAGLRIKRRLANDRGDMSIYTCFLVMGVVILVAFLLLYASVKITCINIRNGAKMELNNLSTSIYADTYRSQRETNFSEYLNTLYSSSDYTAMLEETVTDGLANKLPLSTDDYQVRNISLSFHVAGDRVEYVFSCDAEFYIFMFGRQYPAITRPQPGQTAFLLCLAPAISTSLYNVFRLFEGYL